MGQRRSPASAVPGFAFVEAYTPQGQLRWAQRAGGSGSDAGSHIGLDASGEVRVLG
ncbi:hypothetical protein [uncultured Hymenobacter sp.]|uniref:hypothetical protein n=1 Tax=uncultured Hymenobacter sp. TaxID=170016 RepID=UPI0035CBB0C9